MKLTKTLRDTFIEKVISKIPTTDFISQIQELLNKEAFSQLPVALQNKELLHYLELKIIYFRDFNCLGGFYVRNKEYIVTDETRLKVYEIHGLFAAQRNKKQLIERQLYAIIYNASTLKKAKEITPIELHQYLPSEEIEPIKNALVTTELIDNLKSVGIEF